MKVGRNRSDRCQWYRGRWSAKGIDTSHVARPITFSAYHILNGAFLEEDVIRGGLTIKAGDSAAVSGASNGPRSPDGPCSRPFRPENLRGSTSCTRVHASPRLLFTLDRSGRAERAKGERGRVVRGIKRHGISSRAAAARRRTPCLRRGFVVVRELLSSPRWRLAHSLARAHTCACVYHAETGLTG